ncbi:hypothetical protein, partial [Morganella morganii]|uniref:hypothetical protein n=1 Tax=Morganella morganii TaxID=582 RepID=UPI0021CDFFF5
IETINIITEVILMSLSAEQLRKYSLSRGSELNNFAKASAQQAEHTSVCEHCEHCPTKKL